MNIRFFQTLLLLLVILTSNGYSQVVINEIQSSNTSTYQDEFYEYSDWLEIRNVGAAPISLGSYYLSDDRSLLNKWQFPDFTLQANGHCIIFCSGRNLRQAPANYYTLIDRFADWKYLVPVQNISTEWYSSSSFDDNSWPTGCSGFGFADDDDCTVTDDSIITIYLRKKFQIDNLSQISRLLLHMDYDDGFVAYLNGTEVARVNLGAAGTSVSYDQIATAGHEAALYQGGTPESFDISSFISLLHTGENLLAIEVHNNGIGSTDVSAIPFLTIGITTPLQIGQSISTFIPLGNSVPHTNFKLKTGEEPVYLSNSAGFIYDSISPLEIPANISYGRLYSNSSIKRYFQIPTPGMPNNTEGLKKLSNDTVIFSKSGGYFNTTVLLTISGNSDSIFWTADGSDPTIYSSLYTGPLTINSDVIVKARVIKNGYMPGRMFARTFYNGHSSSLPVFCISTDPVNLWDDYVGMYVLGLNYQTDYPFFGANFWQEWEKPFQIEVYDRSNHSVIYQAGGAKIHGNWSRARPQKSFALLARKIYGDHDFDYPFFVQKPALTSYKSIVLRNNANDWDIAFMRDALIVGITRHLGVEYQASQSVAAYLNGQYWGLYDLREKVNEDFLANNCHADADDINILQFDGEVAAGNVSSYAELKNFLNANISLASESNYNYVASRIDIDNFIKYQLIQTYIYNNDWPGNNIKFWKTNQPLSKWRWILYDSEFSLGIYNMSDFTVNAYSFALDPDNTEWPNPQWGTLLFRRLVTNRGFRNNFINQSADNINTTFLPDNFNHYVDSIRDQMADEMVYQKSLYGQDYNSWLWELDRIKYWCFQRPSYAISHLEETFDLPGHHKITLNVSSPLEGYIRLNTIYPKNFPFSGIYFEDVPIEIEAIPRPGYKFVRWEGASASKSRILTCNLKDESSFKAVFEEATADDIQIVINEINYNSTTGMSPGDWIELYNNGNTSINLKDYLFRDSNIDSGFVVPEVILPTDGYLIICKNREKFLEVYPFVKNVISGFTFGLSSAGDELRIYDSYGNVIDAVDYLPYAPWPVAANGTGTTLELINPNLDNGQPASWRAIRVGGTPGEINSTPNGIQIHEITESNNELTVFPVHFSDYLTIETSVKEQQFVKLEVIDMQGNIISDLSDKLIMNNCRNLDWIPESDLSSGVYIIRLLTTQNQYHQTVVYSKH